MRAVNKVIGGGEGGNAGGVHAASGGAGFGQRGRGEIADGSGFVEQVLLAELHNLAPGHVHFAEIVEVVGFLEMGHEGAGKNIGGIFEGGFGLRFGVACATGGGSGQGCLGRDGNKSGLEFGQINGEVGRFIAGPDGFICGAVGDVNTRTNHVDLIREADLHNSMVVW